MSRLMSKEKHERSPLYPRMGMAVSWLEVPQVEPVYADDYGGAVHSPMLPRRRRGWKPEAGSYLRQTLWNGRIRFPASTLPML